MRSRAKHDEWQIKLGCRCILLDGSMPLEENLQIIQIIETEIVICETETLDYLASC